mmetsp:Transcript_30827/g.66679  ORF Transcript_30827/g.66679 Transcript_30827/m.66679 type:complete len:229 (+) Transcript_30827:496-1182(+)
MGGVESNKRRISASVGEGLARPFAAAAAARRRGNFGEGARMPASSSFWYCLKRRSSNSTRRSRDGDVEREDVAAVRAVVEVASAVLISLMPNSLPSLPQSPTEDESELTAGAFFRPGEQTSWSTAAESSATGPKPTMEVPGPINASPSAPSAATRVVMSSVWQLISITCVPMGKKVAISPACGDKLSNSTLSVCVETSLNVIVEASTCSTRRPTRRISWTELYDREVE